MTHPDTEEGDGECYYCDIGLEPKTVDGKPVHPVTNPTRDMPCERRAE